MKNLLKKSIVGAAIALAYSSGAFADATLSNGSITAVINNGGSFGVDPVYPLGAPGLSYLGVEFVNIDTPSSWWTLRGPSTSLTSQYNSIPLGGSTTFGGGVASTTLAFGGLTFVQSTVLTAANQISFLVSFTNTGSKALTGLKYGVGIDPDQGGSGNNTTLNKILGQGTGSSVSAADTLYGTGMTVTLANTSTAFPTGIAAYINPGDCCSAVNPATALGAAQSVGFSTLADDSISLAYDIGTIGLGQTVSLGYNYTFSQTNPIPEPETYAMLLAGLGLMGVVARRRKQQSSAV